MLDIALVVLMYTIGSIPFAYLLSLRAGVDLRQHGSRNIGARNAFEVTKRKDIGISVLILDFLKGLIPAVLLDIYLDSPPILPLAIVALVAGHCYSIWLRFQGGRGLATAAGIFVVASPVVLATWLLGYVTAKVISPNVHIRTVLALCAAAVMTFILNDTTNIRLIYRSRSYEHYGSVSLQAAFIMIYVVILLRHLGPLLLLRKTKRA